MDGKAQFSPSAHLNIINLSPWDIYVGNGSNIFSGVSTAEIESFVVYGLNSDYYSNKKFVAPSNGTYAYHSVMIPVNNLNDALVSLSNNNFQSNSTGQVGNLNIPITINSQSYIAPASATTSTPSLQLTVSSYIGFAGVNGNSTFPENLLTFGGGVSPSNSPTFGFCTADTENATDSVGNYLTIQQNDNCSTWIAATPVVSPTRVKTESGTKVACPYYINLGALVYPNFSTNNGSNMDLWVYLQTGDYADASLIFVGVKHSEGTTLLNNLTNL